VIFLLFVLLVAIILFNVLSVAVSEAEEIRHIAETLSLVARVKLIYSTEATPNILWRCMKSFQVVPEFTFVLYPNRRNSIGFAASRSILRIITKKKQPHKRRKSIGNRENLSYFTDKFSELQLRQKELEKNLDFKLQEKMDFFFDIKDLRKN
jgi:hypothetical protein